MRGRKRLLSWVPTVLGLLVFAAVAAWMVLGVREASEVSDREGLRLAEQAVRQAAVSCYALEGTYPATYEDLKRSSGIAVDEEKYSVFYDIFASNIMPDITVLERQG
ncbi:MAG: hypothetical protein HFF77_08875 [Oscillospiraceae bacterium]|jgi:hypothetical protein|nr:hypothetical protein [Oscillospiraceae bacterium]